MKYTDIKFNKSGTEKILKNLGVALSYKGKDISFAWDYDFICGIKVGDYYIYEPTIKTTEILYRVEKDGVLMGLFDFEHLCESI